MGWVGVDLDGTLAEYHGWHRDGAIDVPVPAMMARVRQWIAEGVDVRIMTARVAYQPDSRKDAAEHQAWQRSVINAWLKQHLGRLLPLTATKDYGMIALYDDRAVAVEHNTGRLLSPEIRGTDESKH